MNDFLVVSKKEARRRGWDQPDFVLVTGDAYVDHPSFGAAIIGRVLEAAGFKVAVLAQPYFEDERDMDKLGQPRLGFLVTAGNMDSMVAHYTVNKKRRKKDLYSPGGRTGHRPDRASIVYSKLIRKRFPKANIILGGLEASLRRFAHYDYWADQIRPSILEESEADLLVYGMADQTIVDLAQALNEGFGAKDILWLTGTAYLTCQKDQMMDKQIEEKKMIELASYQAVSRDKDAFNQAFLAQYQEQDARRGRPLIQKQKKAWLVQNPPALALKENELDQVYDLGYVRKAHPAYDGQGGIPAIQEVRFSVSFSRGCFGSCSFCAIAFHQGRTVYSRSKDSVLKEVGWMTRQKDFKGYVHDIGGPTANFSSPACKKMEAAGTCKNRDCLFPSVCPNMEVSHDKYLEVLRAARQMEGVKKVFVRSGIRYDYLLKDKSTDFLNELCAQHVSGQLRVAPEHVVPRVLRAMKKPPIKDYEAFSKAFYKASARAKKDQYLVPYLISSHPASRLIDAVDLAVYLHDHHLRPDQVQDFYPVPGTLATAMYYTEKDPLGGSPVYVAKKEEDKKDQRALLHYYKKENASRVRKALKKAGRDDLIGYGPDCLVSPKRKEKGAGGKKKKRKRP